GAGHPGQRDGPTRLHHGSGQSQRLARIQPPDVRGHQEGGGLIVGDLASGEPGYEGGQVLGGQSPPVPLEGEHVSRVPHPHLVVALPISRRARAPSTSPRGLPGPGQGSGGEPSTFGPGKPRPVTITALSPGRSSPPPGPRS